MKKSLYPLALLGAALLLHGCGSGTKGTYMEFGGRLTEAEKSAGILTPEVMWKMGRLSGSRLSPDGEQVVYGVTYYDMSDNKGSSSLWIQPVTQGEARCLTDTGGSDHSPAWSADGSKIYFLSNRDGSQQIWSIRPDGSELKQVSAIEGGVEGFGIAPTGDRLFYVCRVPVEKHLSGEIHEDMPRSNARIYDDLMVRHWDYWDEGRYMHIFVAGFDGERLAPGRDIMPDEPWDAPLAPYFDMGEITWSHSGKQLAYTCKKLTGTEYAVSTDSDIYVYDVETDRTVNICKPEPGSKALPGYDKYPVFSPDDSRIAFRSMRRAGNESDKERLFVWNSADGSMTDITAGFDYNATNVRWADNDQLVFIAPIEATHQICRVRTSAPGQVEVVTSGDHDVNAFDLAGNRLVAEMTRISMATELFRLDSKGLNQISYVNKEIYDNIRMGEVQKRWVSTTDGKQMLTWVILPPDFDPSKKYPTLLYCQGGPQSVVSQFWSYRWNFQLMAAQGYVVVAPNRRGLPSFGQEWLDQISGDYSGQNIRDYLSAIDNVSAEPWSDRDRMGCVGASYGGYSVFYLAGHHDKRFKAFIAHCGIFDFDSMYGQTEELWFVNNDYGGPYWESENAIAQRSYANSPHKAAGNWDTPILILTGELDYRIPYTQSLEAFTAARVQGIPARLVSFKDENHQVYKPQNSIVWNREFFGWLDRWVKNPER